MCMRCEKCLHFELVMSVVVVACQVLVCYGRFWNRELDPCVT